MIMMMMMIMRTYCYYYANNDGNNDDNNECCTYTFIIIRSLSDWKHLDVKSKKNTQKYTHIKFK